LRREKTSDFEFEDFKKKKIEQGPTTIKMQIQIILLLAAAVRAIPLATRMSI
jgi:hypothetical protein